MVSRKTQSLFWLNIKSLFNCGMGGILIFISLFLFFVHWGFFILSCGLGIFLLIVGNQQKLEYKMKSGYIVYNGR